MWARNALSVSAQLGTGTKPAFGLVTMEEITRMGQGKRLTRGASRWKDGFRWCSRCRDYRDPETFPSDKSRSDGLALYCSPCRVARNRARQYGVDYDAEFLAREGRCDACKTAYDVLCVDHDHSCCKPLTCCEKCFRGLLCAGCNTALGLMKDNVETLARAITYLTAFRDKA